MKINYEVYGCILELNFQNDLLLMEHLKNQVGKIIEKHNAINATASFLFVKTEADHLPKIYESFDFDEKTEVYIEPTHERGIVGYVNNQSVIVHFYAGYYLVIFSEEQQNNIFYYCENFLSIDYILVEFFKYCIFPIKMRDAWIPLHSSCVISPKTGKAILFVGDSGCGKSSSALLMTMKYKYEFCNDEVTYIYCDDEAFFANPTSDKIKICQEMYETLLYNGIHLITNKLECEYVCDVSSMRRSYDIVHGKCEFPVEIICFLKRDDTKKNIEISQPDTIAKYRSLIENCNISVWTNKKQKSVIINTINRLVKKAKFVTISYPTVEIQNVVKVVESIDCEY